MQRLVLLSPIALAVVFAWMFGTSFPLTDEWTFTNAVMVLGDLQSTRIEWLHDVWDHSVLVFNGHQVAVAFAIYWLIASAVHFNSAVLVGVTFVGLTAQLIVFYRRLSHS